MIAEAWKTYLREVPSTPGLASAGSTVVLEWQEAASCLQRHARQPCCAETIKMHLQNEVLCFIAIVYQGMTLLLSEMKTWTGLFALSIIAFLWNIIQCGTTQTSDVQSASARAKQKNKSKPRTKASDLFSSFYLSTGDCLFPLASNQKDSDNPSSECTPKLFNIYHSKSLILRHLSQLLLHCHFSMVRA